jgi:hypothetical protein
LDHYIDGVHRASGEGETLFEETRLQLSRFLSCGSVLFLAGFPWPRFGFRVFPDQVGPFVVSSPLRGRSCITERKQTNGVPSRADGFFC